MKTNKKRSYIDLIQILIIIRLKNDLQLTLMLTKTRIQSMETTMKVAISLGIAIVPRKYSDFQSTLIRNKMKNQRVLKQM